MMGLNMRRRVWQAVLTLSALLITILAPLGGTALYAAASSTSDTSTSASVSAPSTGRSTTARLPNAVAAIGVAPTLANSTQFDITGFLQSATLDPACVAAAGVSLDAQGNPLVAHCGGTAQINGHTIIVPNETIAILPASALTWQELFALAPAPYGPTQTGMALGDNPKPLTTYEVQMVGNRVLDPNGVNGCAVAAGCDRYIAGLVHVAQQDLNSGAGYISFINYATGEIEVGGTPGVAGTGARVQINDPANPTSGSGGRYGRATTPDVRFQVDQDNPTIAAETGFPMCIPRTAPTAAGATTDPLCPEENRPNVSNPVADTSGITPQPNTLVAGQPYTLFRMDSPANVDFTIANPALPSPCLRTPCADPRLQAPFEIGDYVTFAGTLTQDPAPATTTYISAHTIVASLGIYTQTGVDPAYVSVETALIGTGGLTVFGAGEAAIRTRFEGMSTDESRLIRIYGVDINPITGATSDREWGTVMPDPGPPGGAVRGRWRFRPPCTGTAATVTDKICTPPPGGNFIPPPREVRAVVTGLSQFNPGTITANTNSQIPNAAAVPCAYVLGIATAHPCTTANGIFYGQYHAPIGEYIFPENVPGTAVPENNFNTINFLAYGGYQSLTTVQAGRLSPWPSSIIPAAPVCASPMINGAPYSVANGASIKLSGSVTANATTPVSVNWTAGTLPGGTDLNGALTGANTTTPTFNATGLAAGVYNLTFTAANVCGVAVPATTTITVQPVPPPTINPIQNQTVTAGTSVTINATSASLPAPTWAWAQTAGPAVPFVQAPAAGTPSANSAITFTPPAGVYTFSVTATNANGTSSVTTVTITANTALPVNVTLTPVEYRLSNQRLVITATSLDPTVTSMVLMPYQTETGTTFDPATLGANLTVSLIAPGSFTITLVGAPKPACNLGGAYATPCAQKPITVKSINPVSSPGFSGTSAPTALTRIR